MAAILKRVRFHYSGFNELRKSPEIAAELERRGQAIADAAGGEPDFVVESMVTGSRARVVVVTATAEGMASEASDRVLTNALNAGRS